MAHRHAPKQQKTFAASAAVLVMAAILGAPSIAATSHSITSSEISEATLEVPASALIPEAVSQEKSTVPTISEAADDDIESVSSASLLVPRAEAAIRDAFKESERSKETLSQTVPVSDMKTKLPGVSDAASSRYKKQMFRRDI